MHIINALLHTRVIDEYYLGADTDWFTMRFARPAHRASAPDCARCEMCFNVFQLEIPIRSTRWAILSSIAQFSLNNKFPGETRLQDWIFSDVFTQWPLLEWFILNPRGFPPPLPIFNDVFTHWPLLEWFIINPQGFPPSLPRRERSMHFTHGELALKRELYTTNGNSQTETKHRWHENTPGTPFGMNCNWFYPNYCDLGRRMPTRVCFRANYALCALPRKTSSRGSYPKVITRHLLHGAYLKYVNRTVLPLNRFRAGRHLQRTVKKSLYIDSLYFPAWIRA